MSKQTEDALSGHAGIHQGNAGEPTEPLKDVDEALNDEKLITTMEDRLKNLGEITRTPAAETEDDETEEEDDETENDDEPPAKETDSDEPDKESPDSPTLDEHVLPEAYVRAAEGWGWKRDDAIEFFNKDPERALRTFENIYQSRNRASAEFAAIGRARSTESPKEDEVPQFKPVDTAKLREQYGDEAGPLIEMIEAQNKTLNQLAERLPRGQKPDNRVFDSAVEESGVEQQIHAFFESDGMKPWEKVYGKLEFGETWDDLPPGQKVNRMRLLQKADQIVGGAHLQRVDMKLEEALEAAHLLVTQKYRDQVLIDGIRKQVIQRSRAITTKPSQATRKPGKEVTEEPKPGTRTREQLIADTDKKLRRLYGSA